jgi:hypothetical protein
MPRASIHLLGKSQIFPRSVGCISSAAKTSLKMTSRERERERENGRERVGEGEGRKKEK